MTTFVCQCSEGFESGTIMCMYHRPAVSKTSPEEINEVSKFLGITDALAAHLLKTRSKEMRARNLERFEELKKNEPSQEFLDAAPLRRHKPIVIKAKGEK